MGGGKKTFTVLVFSVGNCTTQLAPISNRVITSTLNNSRKRKKFPNWLVVVSLSLFLPSSAAAAVALQEKSRWAKKIGKDKNLSI
jgi:hypothetical protein